MVVIYTIGCPACEILEKKLICQGIPFQKVTNPEIFRQMGIDQEIFPKLLVNGQLLDYGDAIKWVNNYQVEENNG